MGGRLTGVLFNGVPFDIPYYQLDPGVEVPAGLTLSNRPDWDTTYNGVDLTFQKRLSDRWLVRGGATYQTWNQHGYSASCYDPTSDRGGNNELWPGTPIGIQTGSTCAGNDIAALPAGAASGARNEVFLNARWMFNVGGLYQLPAGFAVAANFFGREGYPYINYYRFDPGDGLGPRDNIITSLGKYRYGDVYELDLRLEKVITVNPLEITLVRGRLQRRQLGNRSPAQRSRRPRPGRVQPDHRDAESARRSLRGAALLLGSSLRSSTGGPAPAGLFFIGRGPCPRETRP